MDCMSESRLPHGQLPPIPDGCGILPIAENRIARGPHPELLDALPEGFEPLASGPDREAPVVNDALEQTYRRVLARALGLAACALLLAAAMAASLSGNPGLRQGMSAPPLVVRMILISQVLFLGFCSRYVEKLAIAPAAILLFAYAGFCSLEYSALLPPATVAVAFLCSALMYGATAWWGFRFGTDLARPVTPIFAMLGGGVILIIVNLLFHTRGFAWTLSSLAVVLFAGLEAYFAEQIRDFYQEFDDDNAAGWKASVLGALLLLVNSVNILIVAGSVRRSEVRDSSDDLPR
jgi:FtsH-binding integral membrane protein